MSQSLTQPNSLQHIAVIMDGNGRWAKERGLPRLEGHKAGAESDSAGKERETEDRKLYTC